MWSDNCLSVTGDCEPTSQVYAGRVSPNPPASAWRALIKVTFPIRGTEEGGGGGGGRCLENDMDPTEDLLGEC